jgi:O-antigen/teichoic acid export membrane protein
MIPRHGGNVAQMERIKVMAAWRPGRLAHNVAHVGGWNALRIALQALNLVLLARVFGPELYGALSGSVALYLTAAQFVGLGTGISLVRHVSRGGEAIAKLRSIQRVYVLSGLCICVLAWATSTWLFGHYLPAGVLLMLAAADIAVMPLVVPLACRFQAEERLGMTSALLTIAPVARCAAVTILLLIGVRSIGWYAAIYLLGMSSCVGMLLVRLWPRGNNGTSTLPSIASEVGEGIRYAVSSATVTANSELDKSVMLRLAGELATGHYSAASRVAQAAIMPVQALLVSISPRWFRDHAAETSLRNLSLAFGFSAIYSLVAALACWLAAPFLPILLGQAFSPSIPLLQLLGLAIISGSLRLTTMTVAMTSDLQTSRNLIEITCLGLSLLIMFLLVPRYGGIGAVISIVISDVCAISLGAAALLSQNRFGVDSDYQKDTKSEMRAGDEN